MVVQGLDEWKKLEGKTVGFEFNLGWGDTVQVTLDISTIRRRRNEFGTPMVQVLGDNGGYSFYESDTTEVTVID